MNLAKLHELETKVVDLAYEILEERVHQNIKFTGTPTGTQHHNVMTWGLILGEESGEVLKAALEDNFSSGRTYAKKRRELRTELIQTAAVAMAIIERIDAKDPALDLSEGIYDNQP